VSVISIIDILLVAIVIYEFLALIKGTRASLMLVGAAGLGLAFYFPTGLINRVRDPFPGDPRLARVETVLVATPKRSLEAAASLARSRGLGVVVLGDNLEGEARELGAEHARAALDIAAKGGGPTVVLSGGETTVTVRGTGRGGRNVEYLLAEAITALESAGARYEHALALNANLVEAWIGKGHALRYR
jgi:hypothetical protein